MSAPSLEVFKGHTLSEGSLEVVHIVGVGLA